LARFEWKRLRLIPVVFVSVFVFAVIDYAIRGPQARHKQIEIEEKLSSIPDLKSAKVVNSSSGFKTGGGYARRILEADVLPDQIDSYYRQQLEQRGWFFLKKEVRLSKARVIFCSKKGDQVAMIELPESVRTTPYKYTLALNWGIDCRLQ